MRAFRRLQIAVPVISIVASFALSAQAQEQQHKPPQGQGKAAAPAARPAMAPRQGQVRGPQGQGAHVAHGNFPARNFGGHAYHGHLAWEGGRWRHEMHNGRLGWWWDVGGAWYFYPQPMEGPPAYVSDVEVMDDAYAGGPDGPMARRSAQAIRRRPWLTLRRRRPHRILQQAPSVVRLSAGFWAA